MPETREDVLIEIEVAKTHASAAILGAPTYPVPSFIRDASDKRISESRAKLQSLEDKLRNFDDPDILASRQNAATWIIGEWVQEGYGSFAFKKNGTFKKNDTFGNDAYGGTYSIRNDLSGDIDLHYTYVIAYEKKIDEAWDAVINLQGNELLRDDGAGRPRLRYIRREVKEYADSAARLEALPYDDHINSLPVLLSNVDALYILAEQFEALGTYRDANTLSKECSLRALAFAAKAYPRLLSQKEQALAREKLDIDELDGIAQGFVTIHKRFDEPTYSECEKIAKELFKIVAEERARKDREKLYNRSKRTLHASDYATDFFALERTFRSLADYYADAAVLADECKRRANDVKQIGETYSEATTKMMELRDQVSRDPEKLRRLSSEWEKLSARFTDIAKFENYENSAERANECTREAERLLLEADRFAGKKRNRVIRRIVASVILLFIAAISAPKVYRLWDADRNFYHVAEYVEGLAAFTAGPFYNRRMGFVNEAGEEVIPAIYTNAYFFSDGLAAVCENKKWGYIDQQGEYIIPAQYDVVDGFISGHAAVGIRGKNNDGDQQMFWGIIDKGGTTILPLQYAIIEIMNEHYAAARIDAGDRKADGTVSVDEIKYGLIDILTGEVVLPYQYTDIIGIDGDLVVVRITSINNNHLSDGYGVVSVITGEEVVPISYRNITFQDNEIVAGRASGNPAHRYDRTGRRLE